MFVCVYAGTEAGRVPVTSLDQLFSPSDGQTVRGREIERRWEREGIGSMQRTADRARIFKRVWGPGIDSKE